MNGIAFIIAAALLIGVGALGVLIWALNSGQYDDPDGDAVRILLDDPDEPETFHQTEERSEPR
jgi:cbb3-type cytochrome oxidase maturation protein